MTDAPAIPRHRAARAAARGALRRPGAARDPGRRCGPGAQPARPRRWRRASARLAGRSPAGAARCRATRRCWRRSTRSGWTPARAQADLSTLARPGPGRGPARGPRDARRGDPRPVRRRGRPRPARGGRAPGPDARPGRRGARRARPIASTCWGSCPASPTWGRCPRRSRCRAAPSRGRGCRPGASPSPAARRAVYPFSTPGGWHLIGRTPAHLWDLRQEPPAILRAGERVRFVPERGDRRCSRCWAPACTPPIQDGGRPDASALGVPRSGAVDPLALAAANMLLGNAPDAAAVEMTLLGPELAVLEPCVVALAGADFQAKVPEDGRRLRPGTTPPAARGHDALLRGGPRRRPRLPRAGRRRGRAGGARLALHRAGGRLRGARWPAARGGRPDPAGPSGRCWAWAVVPGRVPGRTRGWPRMSGRARCMSSRARTRPSSRPRRWSCCWRPPGPSRRAATGWASASRGPPLPPAEGPEPASLGMTWGAVQVPAGGAPIVLLADHPTVGGYRVIAVAASVDRPVLGQLRAGDEVRFARIDLARARRMAPRGRRCAAQPRTAACGWRSRWPDAARLLTHPCRRPPPRRCRRIPSAAPPRARRARLTVTREGELVVVAAAPRRPSAPPRCSSRSTSTGSTPSSTASRPHAPRSPGGRRSPAGGC